MYNKYVKRFLDIIFSIILIVCLFPVFIVIGIISKLSVGNVFYLQKRDGLNKRSFIIYKFKTMIDSDKPDELRTPKVMKFIRNLGLDELPQLFNIFKGEMSFVGPRPFITGEVLPSEPERIIYTVKPGVVSLAIANGRRVISHQKRLKYDYIYATNVSFKLDLYIVFKTICLLITQNFRGEA